MDEKLFVSIALAAGAMLLFNYGLQIFLAVQQLRRIRFAKRSYTLVEREEIPDELRSLFDLTGEKLRTLGFRHVQTRRISSLMCFEEDSPAWLDLYMHPASGCHAQVLLAEVPEPGRTVNCTFSAKRSGQHLITLNRSCHQLFPYPPTFSIDDALADSLESQWSFHLARLEGLRQVDRLPEAYENFVAEELELFDYWLASGFMLAAGEGFRMSWRGAWRYLKQVLAGNRRIARLPPMRDIEAPELLCIADRHAWEVQERLRKVMAMPVRSNTSGLPSVQSWVWQRFHGCCPFSLR